MLRLKNFFTLQVPFDRFLSVLTGFPLLRQELRDYHLTNPQVATLDVTIEHYARIIVTTLQALQKC